MALAAANPDLLSQQEKEIWYCTAYVSAIAYQIEEVIANSSARPVRQIAESEGKILEKTQLLMLLITTLSLLSTALGVSNLVSANIMERSRELGLLKAIGATNLGHGDGLSRSAATTRQRVRAYGANLLIIPANEAATFEEGKISDVREILSGHEVIGAAPFLYERLEINKQYILTGGTNFDELQKVSPYWQIEGNYPATGEREVLIGAQLAKIFSPYEPSEIIGQEITISAGEGTAMKKYVVSGIVSTGGKEEEFAFMNLDDLQQTVGKPNQISIAQCTPKVTRL